ncbi:MAG: HTTM domain-containing protein [Bacteroidota bacterium]
MAMVIDRISKYLKQPISIAPLVIFRIAFGALMFLSIGRFILKGWVYNMYVLPKMHFPYYGFEWVKPISETGMYMTFVLLLLASIGILVGAFYRLSTILFFLLFTYVELIDKTNYLNHYYFVSLVSFILIFLPAGKNLSFDNKFFNRAELTEVPRFFIFMIQLQMFTVYFFAGIAKLNYDWLFEAQPLKLWLPAFSHFPIIGGFMEKDWVAYLFCWFGCVYDLSIGFFLFNKRTVNTAYVFVMIFHLATALFFNIGMFPYIMMTITIIFFKEEFHVQILNKLKSVFNYTNNLFSAYSLRVNKSIAVVFSIYFLIQVILPFRYLLYDGKLFWTEQGYRFSWRVMLMEKAGTAFFFVRDAKSGRETEVDNKKYLTYMQEKMMATQPDMMVDYAKFLKQEFIKKGYTKPTVRAQSFVTLNGSGSREFINSQIDLSVQSNSFLKNKDWVKSY